jgi:dTDP-4-dehydrorhamnose reductase
MLGHDLVATAPAHVELVPLTRAQLDITRQDAVEEKIAHVRPDMIMNAAAYTAVDRAETDGKGAFRVNAEAVSTLAHLAARSGIRLIHFSTDYVFDGNASAPYPEDAAMRPINVYGASKMAGEEAARASGARCLLIRTQWLFGTHGQSFPRTMWERARKGLATKVVSDQTGRPTYTPDVARAVWELSERASSDTLHIANSGCATWYDLASYIFSLAGRADLVAPCATDDYPTRAARPRYTALSTEKAERLLGMKLPPWSTALATFLRNLDETAVAV